MNVTASCTLDFQALKAMFHIFCFGKTKPEKKLVIDIVYFALSFGLSILLGILFEFSSTVIILAVVCILAALLQMYLYFLFPRIQAKANKKLLGGKYDFAFYDDNFTVTSELSSVSENSTIQYDYVLKVNETSAYLILILHNNHAFIVKKSALVNNEGDLLQNRLRKDVKKYVVCKY